MKLVYTSADVDKGISITINHLAERIVEAIKKLMTTDSLGHNIIVFIHGFTSTINVQIRANSNESREFYISYDFMIPLKERELLFEKINTAVKNENLPGISIIWKELFDVNKCNHYINFDTLSEEIPLKAPEEDDAEERDYREFIRKLKNGVTLISGLRNSLYISTEIKDTGEISFSGISSDMEDFNKVYLYPSQYHMNLINAHLDDFKAFKKSLFEQGINLL